MLRGMVPLLPTIFSVADENSSCAAQDSNIYHSLRGDTPTPLGQSGSSNARVYNISCEEREPKYSMLRKPQNLNSDTEWATDGPDLDAREQIKTCLQRQLLLLRAVVRFCCSALGSRPHVAPFVGGFPTFENTAVWVM
jgi:hypothetical protein